MYDEEHTVKELLLEGDVGTALIVRRFCLTPKASSEEDWLRSNIFQSTCTIKDKVCRFAINGGSYENIVSAEAVQKLGIMMRTKLPFVIWRSLQNSDNGIFIIFSKVASFRF